MPRLRSWPLPLHADGGYKPRLYLCPMCRYAPLCGLSGQLSWVGDLGVSRVGEAAWVDERDETPVGS